MIDANSWKLLMLLLLLTANLCSCKHHPRRRRFTQNLDSRRFSQPRQSFSGVDASNGLFPWRHRKVDVYTDPDFNIDNEPNQLMARKQRRTRSERKVETREDHEGPNSIHNRVNAILRKVQLENVDHSKLLTKRGLDDVDRKLDSLVYRYRLKRSDGLLSKKEFNEMAVDDDQISQDVNRQIAKIKEETVNDMYANCGPMKKREESCDKAERRLNFLLSLKSCEHE